MSCFNKNRKIMKMLKKNLKKHNKYFYSTTNKYFILFCFVCFILTYFYFRVISYLIYKCQKL